MRISLISQHFDACFLVDNGSLRPAAVLDLRSVARQLSENVHFPVKPVSVLHSSKIPAKELGGQAAETFEAAVRTRLESGLRSFLVIPLFFGPSRALTEYLPECFSALAAKYPDTKLVVASPLAGDEAKPDPRIAKALCGLINEVVALQKLDEFGVVLVDHGSPVRGLAAIRDAVGAQLAELLDPRCRAFAASSMERRSDPEYTFNDPLLERVLGTDGFVAGPVIVTHLFLFQGRHAGAGGDIFEICSAAEKKHPELRCIRTSLLGDHPLILEILTDRLHQAMLLT